MLAHLENLATVFSEYVRRVKESIKIYSFSKKKKNLSILLPVMMSFFKNSRFL